MKKYIATFFYIIGISSALLAIAVDTSNIHNLTRLFCIFLISWTIALTLTYLDKIRRITYPALVCICACIYKHRITMTKFTRNAFRIYKMNGHSYIRLYDYVQNLFDMMCNEETI